MPSLFRRHARACVASRSTWNRIISWRFGLQCIQMKQRLWNSKPSVILMLLSKNNSIFLRNDKRRSQSNQNSKSTLSCCCSTITFTLIKLMRHTLWQVNCSAKCKITATKRSTSISWVHSCISTTLTLVNSRDKSSKSEISSSKHTDTHALNTTNLHRQPLLIQFSETSYTTISMNLLSTLFLRSHSLNMSQTMRPFDSCTTQEELKLFKLITLKHTTSWIKPFARHPIHQHLASALKHRSCLLLWKFSWVISQAEISSWNLASGTLFILTIKSSRVCLREISQISATFWINSKHNSSRIRIMLLFSDSFKLLLRLDLRRSIYHIAEFHSQTLQLNWTSIMIAM